MIHTYHGITGDAADSTPATWKSETTNARHSG